MGLIRPIIYKNFSSVEIANEGLRANQIAGILVCAHSTQKTKMHLSYARQGALPRVPEKSLADQPIISLDSPGFRDIMLSEVALHDDECFFRVEPSLSQLSGSRTNRWGLRIPVI